MRIRCGTIHIVALAALVVGAAAGLYEQLEFSGISETFLALWWEISLMKVHGKLRYSPMKVYAHAIYSLMKVQ